MSFAVCRLAAGSSNIQSTAPTCMRCACFQVLCLWCPCMTVDCKFGPLRPCLHHPSITRAAMRLINCLGRCCHLPAFVLRPLHLVVDQLWSCSSRRCQGCLLYMLLRHSSWVHAQGRTRAAESFQFPAAWLAQRSVVLSAGGWWFVG